MFLFRGKQKRKELNQFQFEDIDSLFQIEKRNIAVFIYTDWCRYCKNMEQNTFQNQKVIQQLNNHFYFISLDGEERREIDFQGYKFSYQPTGNNTGTHALAEALGSVDGKLSFPSFCVMNSDFEIIFQYNAFLNAKDLSQVLDKIIQSEN